MAFMESIKNSELKLILPCFIISSPFNNQKQLLETKEAVERQRKSLKKRQSGKFFFLHCISVFAVLFVSNYIPGIYPS